MDKKIENKDRVSKETIQVYQQINIYDVIKETLLCKGVEICTGDRLVAKKYLEDSALYLYELKANSTNRLHVGLTIDRLCQRNGFGRDIEAYRNPFHRFGFAIDEQTDIIKIEGRFGRCPVGKKFKYFLF